MIGSMANIYYLMLIRPFAKKSQNILEVFNEVCILICIYHIVVFTELCDDPLIQFDFGWSLNAFALL